MDERQKDVFKQYIKVVAYAEDYRFWPPPWFIPTVTVLTTLFFAINRAYISEPIDTESFQQYSNCSYLIYK